MISKLSKLKRTEIKSRILKFIICFIVIIATNYIFNFIFQPSEIDDLNFGTALGLGLGISFFDLAFFNKKENK